MKRGKRTRRRTRRGGKNVGEGSRGSVYTKPEPEIEALLLSEGCEWKDGYVVKISNGTKAALDDAEKEMKAAAVLGVNKNIQGVIYPESECKLKDGRIAQFSIYGGPSLEMAANKFTTADEFARAYAALETLRGHIEAMHTAGIYHNDIHIENILYNGTDAKLVDFGMFGDKGWGDDLYNLQIVVDELKLKESAKVRKTAGSSKRRTRKRSSYRSR